MDADTDIDETDTQPPDAARGHGAWLRLVPPVAALGTAFVLQVIAMTDTVGSALAGQWGTWAWIGAAMLGVSVASCAEGGAAYLMDLYDKHLLAGDSTWMLRIAMIAYVSASAGVIHWWTGHRGLPAVISWVLAGMSASAMFLWSRGARWRRRDQMRAAGLIDPAMPRMSAQARLLHPLRWITTLWLISWEPAATVAEARARHEAWRTRRHGQTVPAAPGRPAPRPRQSAPDKPSAPRARTLTVRPPAPNVVDLSGRRDGQPSIDDLADTLGRECGARTVGAPTAMEILRGVHGSCSRARAIAAKDVHNRRVAAGQVADADDSEPVQEAAL